MTLSINDLNAFKSGGKWQPDLLYPGDSRRFYSPEDDVHGVLKAVLGAATQSLVLAMYGFDDDELAELCAHALDNPRMYCQITLDKSQAGGVHERAILDKYKHEFSGNSVAIGNSEKGAIMHRKMVIVDGVWLITGSTNWSTSGESLQDNELTVTYSPSAAAEARRILDIAHDHALQKMVAK